MYNTYFPQQYQQYPMRQDFMPQPAQQAGGFVCRPVTSRAEAEVYQIPFDGSTTYFVDTGNGKIYAKTFNAQTGTAPLVTFSREEEVAVQYATLADVQALREEIMSAITPRKAGKKNDAADE